MTDSASEDETVQLIELKVKTIKETYQLSVRENTNIEKLKIQLSEKINQPTEKICLIFSGKILKDHETLKEHKIVDGMVIHMVIKNPPTTSSRESTPSSASSTLTGSQTTATTGAPGSAPAGPFGGIGAILNNPMVRDMMNSPLVENLLSNPNMTDMVRNLLADNPQFQQIIQNNPDLGHILNDPRIIQQTLEMVQNPNMFNELMRNHDQAIRNIQGIPGGEAALHRMYQEVQEPLMNSVLGDAGTGQYAANNTQAQNGSQNVSSRSQHAGVENAEALPNPWSRVVNLPSQQNAEGTASAGAAAGAAGSPFAMMNTPGMQSLMRQVLSNSSTVESLLSSANMQQFGQMIGNPAMAEQMRSLMTNANPQLFQAMANPRVFTAMTQMHQAMQVLNEECPQLFSSMLGGDMFRNLGGILGSVNQQNQPPTSEASAATGVQQGTNSTSPQGPAVQPTANATSQNPAMPAGFAELLGSIALMNVGNMQNAGNTGAADRQPPEERYRPQLEQLTAMGFIDQQANVQALLASFGDINMAIERLLAGGLSPGGGDTPNANGGNVERTD
uniref:Ubiquilin n=1 Tax=Meloidogyne incognita TaxID=6306 RepID=A0A914LA37_MELIC